jgi:hypothetical protein
LAGAAGSSAGVEPPTRLNPVPPPNSSWSLPTGDPLNATRPVLAAISGGVVVAGSSADPATVGVDEFAEGIVSEAFVARLDYGGAPLWATPLFEAGLPREVDVDVNGDIVVVAPYLPDSVAVTPSTSQDDLYIAKLSPDGSIVFERQVSFDLGQDGTTVYGMATDSEAAIYLAGMAHTVGAQHPLIAKYDANGDELWVQHIEHTGRQGWANDVVALPDNRVVVTGYFDGTIDFGGGILETRGDSYTNGFLASFDSDGGHIASDTVGGSNGDGCTALTALGDDAIVTGNLTVGAVVGGLDVDIPEEVGGSPFVASIDAAGTANWVGLTDGQIGRALDTDGYGNVYLAGQLGGERIVVSYDAEGTSLVEATAGGGAVDSYAIAVDDNFGLWVAGTFTGSVDFGNGNVLESEEPGVFLVRFEREPL